jgi:serine/threonine protein kinase
LGVLLYELLTGQLPFGEEELLRATFDEMRWAIQEQRPVRPSARLGTVESVTLANTAVRRQTDPQKLIRQLRGDLDGIVMKCLEKDRNLRYATAHCLAMDLQRHLNHEPVQARLPEPSPLDTESGPPHC